MRSKKVRRSHARECRRRERNKNRLFATFMRGKTPKLAFVFSTRSKSLGSCERYIVYPHTKTSPKPLAQKRHFLSAPPGQEYTKPPECRRREPEKIRLFVHTRKYTRNSPSLSPPGRKACGLTNVTLYMRIRKPNFTTITRSKKALFERAPSSKVNKGHASGKTLGSSPLESLKNTRNSTTLPPSPSLSLTLLPSPSSPPSLSLSHSPYSLAHQIKSGRRCRIYIFDPSTQKTKSGKG